MAVIDLTKGQPIDLTKASGGTKFEMRAKWRKLIRQSTKVEESADVDITAVVCGSSGLALTTDINSIVYYKNLSALDGALTHSGDKTDGNENSDDWREIVTVDFSRIPNDVENIPLIVTIHDAKAKSQNFGMMRNLLIEIYDVDNKKAVATFKPELTDFTATSLVLGEFKKDSGSAYFKAIGQGAEKTLAEILGDYGFQTKS